MLTRKCFSDIFRCRDDTRVTGYVFVGSDLSYTEFVLIS